MNRKNKLLNNINLFLFITTTRAEQRRRVVVDLSLRKSNIALQTTSFLWLNHLNYMKAGIFCTNV